MTRIDLDVKFHEKDEAKSLGANWDSTNKVWYADSSNPNLPELAKWMPKSSAIAPANTSLVEQADINASSLSIHLQRASVAIRKSFEGADWIVADIVKINHINGNCFIELAEYDNNQAIVAKCKANIWSNNLNNLRAKFKAGTGTDLVQDIKVLLKVATQFDTYHGFTLVVHDIDPNYTLGSIEANLRKIRESLKQSKIIDLNKKINIPKDYFRVAVISPKEAAGLEDFRRDAVILHNRRICHFDYFTATFQGQRAVNEIDDAIEQVLHSHQTITYDALCIIRGGGSKSDLDWLNSEKLARQMCNAPMPVFTGIGHAVDKTILDEVACKEFDTPSKVIKFIEANIFNNANTAQSNFEAIYKTTDKLILKTERTLQHLNDTVLHLASKQVTSSQTACDALSARVSSGLKVVISEASKMPDLYFNEIKEKSQQLVNTALIKTSSLNQQICSDAKSKVNDFEVEMKQQLNEIQLRTSRQVKDAQLLSENLMSEITRGAHSLVKKADEAYVSSYRNIFAMGTNPTLKRGFTITRSDNKPVSKLANIDRSKSLEIEFQDGKITVEIKEK